MKRKNKDVVFWNIPVPKALDDEVEEAVQKDRHMTKAELIRAAVRTYLDMLKKGAK
jgi:Arc/MetJ-type ribon-helix-helix transcriptional regulator